MINSSSIERRKGKMQGFWILFCLILTLLPALRAQTVRVDGSSTVFPIGEAVAEEFQIEQSKRKSRTRVTVGLSGTGGGFKKFLQGEIDVTQASRHISDQEKKDAKKSGLDFIELMVAYDGLSVAVHNDLPIDKLTIGELKKIWEPGSKIKVWQDLRKELPATPIKLYGPGTDSGTFDYFTEVVNGKHGHIRQDFSPSEDDNMLVRGVSSDKSAMGYFGLAYYEANKTKVKLVAIENPTTKKYVSPSESTVKDNSYSPLSRPLFIYVSRKAAERKEVQEFVRFYLEKVPEYIRSTGYIGLEEKQYKKVLSDWDAWLKKGK
jgi:phosphate transport system substrate-binding protein